MEAQKRKIINLFTQLQPLIEGKLKYQNDKYIKMGALQLYVSLKPEDNAEGKPPFTLIHTTYPYIFCVNTDFVVPLPFEEDAELVICLERTDVLNYKLVVSLTSDCGAHYLSASEALFTGMVFQILQKLRDGKFADKASEAFVKCADKLGTLIGKRKEEERIQELFAATDIADYESVIDFVNYGKDCGKLKDLGCGMQLFTYDHAVCLLNSAGKTSVPLVGRDRKALFCTLDDFPKDLLTMIRLESKGWDLDVHTLSVRRFDSGKKAFVTWVISPYFYCPADEDGFGEEEDYEVAVTCHINTDGKLIDTPVWKPYTGPRR